MQALSIAPRNLSALRIVGTCLNMIAPRLQRFLLFILFSAALASAAELQPGHISALEFRDVDGNDHATARGHVTIITVVTREQETEAQAVGDHVPDRCVGDLKYRYLTVINFQRRIPGPLQPLTRAIIRSRLNQEGVRLKPTYAAKKITRDPRQDIFVVADFDGAAVTRLGLDPNSSEVVVFVFNREGKLIARWNNVPSEDALSKAIATAER